jgi:two-component system chemotaxis sensor kinase CheA
MGQAEENSFFDEKAAMLVFKAGEGAPLAIPLALISRLQQIDISQVSESGNEIIAKHNGKLLPLYFINDEGQKLERDIVTTLILSDDVSEAAIGVIIENVIDIVEDHLDLSTSTTRPGIIGSVTLNDNIVDVVDIAHYLEKTKEDFFSVETHQSAPFAGVAKQNLDIYSDQKHVLVVDDSPFFRNMLKPILSAAGYNVTVSEDAIDALKLHDKGATFDAILSDIEMPEMDGYEFIEHIRKDSSWQDIPCIALTSHTTSEDIEYGYQKGFTKYIGKFDKDELTRTLKSVLTPSD